MKKNLMAVVLVVVMLLSCVATVGAAPQSLTDYLALCEDYNRAINVPVDIEGKLPTGTYSDSITGVVGDGAVFRAVLDMTDVKHVADKIVREGEIALSAADFIKLKAMPVTGSFTITATWTGVTAPSDIEAGNLLGFKFDGGTTSIFEEGTSRNLSTSKKSVESTINVKSGVTVNDLTTLPNEIILEIDGFKIVTNGRMDGVIVGTTTIGKGDTGYPQDVNINYAFTDPVAPVLINVTALPNGGGSTSGAAAKNYTVNYEVNGGSTLNAESYKQGSVIHLNKIPEKEGFIFDGWYADAALTQRITSVTLDSNVTVYAAWKEVAAEDDKPVVVHPVPEKLDGGDHFAYISGYPDGTIRPESNITRAEVATIFFRLLKEDVRTQNIATENVFDDVNAGDWFNTAISTMAKLGVVNGRTAKTFAPDEYITRAEFTTICARFDDSDLAGENKFTDVAGHWAEKYIVEAVAYNWINGYEDNTFRPEQNITRAETATLINRVLNRVPESADALLDAMKVWPDNNTSAWYYVAMQEATNSHTFERVNDAAEKWLELAANRDWTVYEK